MGYKESVLACQPVLFLPMDEGSGTTPTILGSAAGGISVAANSLSIQPDHWNFTGTQRLVLNGLPATGINETSTHTWAFWVKTNFGFKIAWRRLLSASAGSYDPRIQFGSTASDSRVSAFGFYMNSNGAYGDALVDDMSFMKDGQWHYVTVQIGFPNSAGLYWSQVRISVDGKFVTMIDHGSNKFPEQVETGPLVIGWNGTSSSAYNFVGQMKGFEYYDRVLTEHEIRMNYEAGSSELSVLEEAGEQEVEAEGFYENNTVTPASFHVLTLPESRFYDVEPLLAMLDAGTNPVGTAEHTRFVDAYGLTLYLNGTTGSSGWTSDPITVGSPEYFKSLRIIYEGISRYPVRLVSRQLGTTRIYAVWNAMQAGNPMGGRAVDGEIVVDMAGGTGNVNDLTGIYYNDGTNGASLIFHHEFAHLLLLHGQVDFNTTEYTSLNTTPYTGTYDIADINTRPQEHFRFYGPSSVNEDTADVSALLWMPEYNHLRPGLMEEDPVLAHKVNVLRDWYVSLYDSMSPWHFRSIHEQP